VFIDHVQKPEYVRNQLEEIEKLARKNGSVIAIGHPHKVTMDELKKWMSKASEEFDFIPISKHAASELDLSLGKNAKSAVTSYLPWPEG